MRWINKLLRLVVIILMLISITGWAGTRDCLAFPFINSNSTPSSQVRSSATTLRQVKRQLKQVKNKIRSLEKYQQQLESLKKKDSTEQINYSQQLSQKISEIGVNSHEQLLRNCWKYLKSCNLLERTALLQHDLAWIETQLKDATKTLKDLKQQEWKLSRSIPPNPGVITRAEIDRVKRTIAKTKKLINDNIPPCEDRELGRLERKIFNQLRKT